MSATQPSPPPPARVGPVQPGRAALSVARLVRWGVAALLVGLTVRLIAADPAPFLELARIDASVLTATVLLMVLNQWLMSWRFRLVMKQCAGVELPAGRWFRLTSVGQFLNLFVPQLGHVYRAVVLQREAHLSYSSYTTSLSVFFWFELLVGLALATLVVVLHEPGFRVAGVYVLPVLLIALSALFALPHLLSALVARVQFSSSRALEPLETTRAALADARRASRQPAFVARFVAINVAVAVEQVAMLGLAFASVGATLDLGRLMLFQVLLKLSAIIIITPANLGITELAYGALAGAASTGVQHGIAAALLMRTIGTLVLIALGAVCGGGSVLIGQRHLLRAPGNAPPGPEGKAAAQEPKHQPIHRKG